MMGSLTLYQRNKKKGSPQEVQISECFPIYRKYSYAVAIGLTRLTFVFHNKYIYSLYIYWKSSV